MSQNSQNSTQVVQQQLAHAAQLDRLRLSRSMWCTSLMLLGLTLLLIGDARAETTLVDPGKQVCLAEVIVPPQFRTDRRDVVTQDAHSTHEVVPARFTNRDEEIVVVDGSTRLKVTQPTMKSIDKEYLVHGASSRWVRGTTVDDPVISDGERQEIVAAGFDVNTLPTGTCLHEFYRAPTMGEEPLRVLAREGSEVLSVIPHQFEDSTESVQVKAPYTRLVEIPTVFNKNSVSVTDSEGKDRVIEQQLVETASFVTRIEEPAEFKTIRMRRLVSDAHVKRNTKPPVFQTLNIPTEVTPAKYRWLDDADVKDARFGKPTGRSACHVDVPRNVLTYEKLTVVERGRIERLPIAAEKRRIVVADLAEDATSTAIEIPAVIETVETKIEVGAATTRMQPVLCESHLNRQIVRGLQRTLRDRGYKPGPVDGKLGRGTQRALAKFQSDASIAGGAMTLESLDLLGINY